MLDKFRAATLEDLDEASQFYIDICEDLPNSEYGPAWVWGAHPSREILLDAIKHGKLLLGYKGNQIAAAGVVTYGEDESYRGANWKYPVTDSEISVIHIFAVSPKFRGQGISRDMLQAIMADIKHDGYKLIHLDALKSNVPAVKLYARNGFEFVEDRDVELKAVGVRTLSIMEYKL